MATHTYQLAINYNSGGQFATNVLHCSFDDAGFPNTAAAAAGLCQGWDAANRTRLRGMLPTSVTILSYRARALQVTGGFEGGLTLSATNAGTRTGTMQVAGIGPVMILYPTGNGTQRGRMFLPGVTDTDCMDGILTTSFHNTLVTNIGGIITPFNVVGGGTPLAQPVIWSRRLLTAFNIGAATASIMIGQVRRRQVPS